MAEETTTPTPAPKKEIKKVAKKVKKQGKRYTEAQKAKVVELLKAGEKMTAIEKKTGVGYQTIAVLKGTMKTPKSSMRSNRRLLHGQIEHARLLTELMAALGLTKDDIVRVLFKD